MSITLGEEINPFLTRERPKTFFKYQSMRFLDDLLSEGRLWFQPQDDQNDIFDGKFEICPHFRQKFFKKVSDKLIHDLESEIQKEKPEFKLCEHVAEAIHLEQEKDLNAFHNVMFNHEWLGWRTCCFTEDPLNELMWAHYADSNKGVCLEFDFSTTRDIQNYLFPVVYTDEFPVIHSFDDIFLSLLKKRLAWSYEMEWRTFTKSNDKLPFDKNGLKTIIFGSRVKSEEIDRIRELLKNNGYSEVAFKQVNLRIAGVKFEKRNEFNPDMTNV